MVEDNPGNGLEIAVIGMAGRFPNARDIEAFWSNLQEGVESLIFYSDEELEKAGINEAAIKHPNFVKTTGGILENIEYFDAAFFDYLPIEAEHMAPPIRIFHECLWEVLEDAGYEPGGIKGLIGLYTGVSSTHIWESLARFSSGNTNLNPFVSYYLSNRDFLSTLVSYKLNLKGPAFLMNTACSTSLVAIHLACQGLLMDDCDMAVAGGISISPDEKKGYFYEEGMINSPDGHCRAFDANAGGSTSGEGVGLAALKRLEDALTDRDNIYAVIKGSAINNDGKRKVGYTAPSVEGQADVIKKAQQMADVNPRHIGYIETHGTATALGDVTEIEALKEVFKTDKRHFCAIGSVKTNIGHLGTAAGVAGFIKTVLALKHKQIPPSLHFEKSNPGIDFENSPFYVNTTLKEWINNGTPLRAGVNSFGIGGTNAHVVLEEAPGGTGGLAPLPMDEEKSRAYQLILLSAKTETALDSMTFNFVEYLKKNPGIHLADAAYTLQAGRRQFQYRRKLVCSDVADAIAAFTSPGSRSVQTFILKEEENKPVVFMFSGLGAQYVNMGWGLYETEPIFRREMDRCFEILNGLLDYEIKEILYPGGLVSEVNNNIPPSGVNRANRSYISNINQTQVAQLVVFIFEYALARLLIEWGIKPHAMVGYSFGEYSAACLSGVFALKDALRLVVARGNLLAELPPGMMLSVPLAKKDLQPLLGDDLSTAIDNGSSCVVSGAQPAVKSFEKQMKEKKIMCMPLDSRHAIHSKMMDPILKKFEAEVSAIPLNRPQIPYISTVTGDWITVQDATSPVYWAKQLRETVRFYEGMQKLLNEPGTLFLEVGAGRDLGALVNREIEDKPGHRVVTMIKPRKMKKEIPDDYYLLDKIGLLWLYGISVNWREYYRQEKRYRVSLPPYPFERHRFWRLVDDYKSGKSRVSRGVQEPGQSKDLAHWFYVPSWKRREWYFTNTTGRREGSTNGCWLVFNDKPGLGERLLERLRNQNPQPVITVKPGTGYEKQNSCEYTIHPRKFEDYETLLSDLHAVGAAPGRILHLWGISPGEREGIEPSFIEESIDFGFYSLLYLARALGRNRHSEGKIEINVVTNHMQELIGDENLHPGKATVLGPCRVIPQEYPHLTCRSIDVVNWEDEGFIQQLLKEILHPADDTIIAYRGNHRWVQLIEPQPLADGETSALLREGGVYLIIGGLGDIGSTLAEYLIKTLRAKLILTGRSVLPPQEMWGQYLILAEENDKTGRALRKMQQLREIGGDVLYYAADLSDKSRMQEVIRSAEADLGQINGVIHSAGIIKGESFNTIEKITDSQCQLQFNAKVCGLLVLEELARDKNLDFCLLISSISTVLGGLGFAAYAAASHFMDTLAARSNQKKKGPWITVDWDGTTKEYTENAFHRIFTCDSMRQVIFSKGGDLEGRITRWVKLEESDEDDRKKKEDEVPLYSRPELTNPYVAPRNTAEHKLAEIWQGFFGMEKIGVFDDLFDLGGDSLKAINILSIIHKEMKAVIPIQEFFDNSTIAGVSRYITGAEKEEYHPVEPAEKKEYYVLSPAQRRLYILQQLDKENIAYNTPMTMVLEPGHRQDPGKIDHVFKRLIERHEIFRTSISMVNQEPVQKIHCEVDFEIEYFDLSLISKGALVNKEGTPPASSPPTEIIVNDFIRPFDLLRPPFLRVGLIKTENQQYILVIDIHHIVTDGVTHEILLKEFTDLYRNVCLSKPRLQYKDYAEWQNRSLQQAVFKKQQNYWLKHFHGQLPVLNLPTDYARPVKQCFEGDIKAFSVTRQETSLLKEMAARKGVTLYMVLLAIYDLFLAKVSSQDDIVVGTGAAGRRHPDLRNIVGIFLNTLAIRGYPQADKTFNQFLQEVKNSCLGAFENQEYPFEDLVDNLDVKRDTGRNPLFDVMFVLQNVEGQTAPPINPGASRESLAPGTGLKVRPFDLRRQVSKFDLTLFCEEANGGLVFGLEYSTKLFKVDTIHRFITYFREIASRAAADPGKRLSELLEISKERKEKILYQLNNELKFEEEGLVKTTLQEKLKHRLHSWTGNIAVDYGEIFITHQELDTRSDYIANWIKDKGIARGTFIGILIDDRAVFIMAMIAILKARCVFVPLDAALPAQRVKDIIITANVKLVLTDSINSRQFLTNDDLSANNSEFVVIEDSFFKKDISWFDRGIEVQYSPEDKIYVYFTSGTTGTPRGMLGKNKSLLHFIRWEIDTFRIDHTFRFSQLTTPIFDAFLRDVFVPLISGGTICIPGKKAILENTSQLIRWLDRFRVHVIHCVPGIFRLLNPGKTPTGIGNHPCYPQLKYILLSGERIHPTDLEEWFENVGERIQLVNLWGTSETTLAKTCYFIKNADIHRERVPVGKPIPGARVVVMKEDREICDDLVVGEVYIKTPFSTFGYINNPGLNDERFITTAHDRGAARGIRLHKTGDLGRRLLDGNIDILGRNDRQVKVRSIRIELEEIENVLLKCPLVGEAVVLKKELSTGNELLCAYVTGKETVPMAEEQFIFTVKEHLSAALPGYMAPAKLVKLEKMPRKPNGKVDVEGLPDPLLITGKAYLLPRDHIEKKLAELWSKLLKIESIGINRNFFELGGNSLNVMALITKIHKEFDIRISLGEIFNNPTIEKQAGIIKKANKNKYFSIENAEEKEYYRLSPAQERLYFLCQLAKSRMVFNILQVVLLEGEFDKKRAEEAFRKIIKRHESFRTSFVMCDGIPVQRIHHNDDVEFEIQYRESAKDKAREIANGFFMPFDLDKAPLLRIGLINLGEPGHVLMIDMHHIVSDGASIALFIGEFMQWYEGKELPPLRQRYRDYSEWLHCERQGERLKKQEEYWLKEFEKDIPVLNLPIDYVRPATQDFKGKRVGFSIEKQDSIKIKALASENHVTMFMMLLAIFNLFLSKLSGQEDIVVGFGVEGRQHEDLRQVIGIFVNTLAFRNYPQRNKTFLEFLMQVKQRTLRAFENQEYPFEKIVGKVVPHRDGSRNPLFDVLFQFENIEIPKVKLQGLRLKSFDFDNPISKFDITLRAMEYPDRLFFSLEYCTALFNDETIRWFIKNFCEIAASVASNPEQELSGIGMFFEEEGEDIRSRFAENLEDE